MCKGLIVTVNSNLLFVHYVSVGFIGFKNAILLKYFSNYRSAI